MVCRKWDALCHTFNSYWCENNKNEAWPKHSTTLAGEKRNVVVQDPNPNWTDREIDRRIKSLKELTKQAIKYNAGKGVVS